MSPKMKWPLGVISEVFPSQKDGVIRTVKIKTQNGYLTRSVPRVHDLEFMCDMPHEPQPLSVSDGLVTAPPAVTESAAEGMEPEPQPLSVTADSVIAPPAVTESAAEGYKTKRGRTVKPPEKLNI